MMLSTISNVDNLPIAALLKHSLVALGFATTIALDLPLIVPFNNLQLLWEALHNPMERGRSPTRSMVNLSKTLVLQLEKMQHRLRQCTFVHGRSINPVGGSANA